jgi:hypothetical protein
MNCKIRRLYKNTKERMKQEKKEKQTVIFTRNTYARIAQSVWRLATGWTIKGPEFEFRFGQEFSLLHVVQIGPGAHPASYPMGTGGSFLGGKATEV